MIDEILRSNKFYEVYFAFTFPKCVHVTILFIFYPFRGINGFMQYSSPWGNSSFNDPEVWNHILYFDLKCLVPGLSLFFIFYIGWPVSFFNEQNELNSLPSNTNKIFRFDDSSLFNFTNLTVRIKHGITYTITLLELFATDFTIFSGKLLTYGTLLVL